jgi:hypothetical protein
VQLKAIRDWAERSSVDVVMQSREVNVSGGHDGPTRLEPDHGAHPQRQVRRICRVQARPVRPFGARSHHQLEEIGIPRQAAEQSRTA